MNQPETFDFCPQADDPVEIDPQLLKLISGGDGEGDGGTPAPPPGDAPKGTW